jgi:hypothetical protein
VHREGRDVVDDEPALRRQQRLLTPSFERAADELLVRERPVGVGRVDQRRTEVEGAADDLDRAVVVALGGTVGPAHRHAAEAHRSRLEPGGR